MDPTRKIALVTGVSRVEGLGFGIVQGLAELGYDVLLTARQRDATRAPRAAWAAR